MQIDSGLKLSLKSYVAAAGLAVCQCIVADAAAASGIAGCEGVLPNV